MSSLNNGGTAKYRLYSPNAGRQEINYGVELLKKQLPERLRQRWKYKIRRTLGKQDVRMEDGWN
jgi:hypothetical protein